MKYPDDFINKIICGDCLEIMKDIPDNSIDAIITDLPYGTTECKWDEVIPFEPMWKEINRLLSPYGVFITTASQPFTSKLITSNLPMFKHEWIWIKNRGSNFANTIREPMKEHESILVFAHNCWKYHKQMQERSGGGIERSKYPVEFNSQPREGTREFEGVPHHKIEKLRVPSSWQKFNVEVGFHPTQKPVALYEYIVRTYTETNNIVLDFAVGSGTTAIACMNTNRRFIGIEKEQKYVDVSNARLSAL